MDEDERASMVKEMVESFQGLRGEAAYRQTMGILEVHALDYYQFAATRTLPEGEELEAKLKMLALGLCGESGEVADLIKKHCYHGHDLAVDRVVRELGDVLWYLACMADVLGVSLSHVAEVNISKLKERYPDGFSEERSRARSVSKDD